MTKRQRLHLSLALIAVAAIVLALALPFTAQPALAQETSAVNSYQGDYYDNLNTDLDGEEFRAQLAKLITDTHTTWTVYRGSSSLSLNNVWPLSDVGDVHNPNDNTMKWFYTGTVVPSDNFGGNAGQTNREHVWAKSGTSTFGASWAEAGPGADAHHLRPTEVRLNADRGDLGFGEVAQTKSNIVAQNGSKSYGSTPDELCYKGANLFYPAKGYRGATARILFYMQVRWGDACSLDFTDGPTKGDGKLIGKISDLMKWHLQEPPTEEEIYRNNIIAGIQGNRNPFIDHPEYAEMIYCHNNASYSATLQQTVLTYGSYLYTEADRPTALTLSAASLQLQVGQSSAKITVTPTPAQALSRVQWSTSDATVATVSDGVVTAVAAGTATITATSVVDNTVTASLTVTVAVDTSPFVQAVQQIEQKTALYDKYYAINEAIEEYNKLPQSAQATVAQHYATLQQAIEDYNAQAAQLNADLHTATGYAAGWTAAAAAAMLAVVAVVTGKGIWR